MNVPNVSVTPRRNHKSHQNIGIQGNLDTTCLLRLAVLALLFVVAAPDRPSWPIDQTTQSMQRKQCFDFFDRGNFRILPLQLPVFSSLVFRVMNDRRRGISAEDPHGRSERLAFCASR
jgi:hypothetical protein